MLLDIGIMDIEQSNDFLGSLWAELENEFGKCQCSYYAPRKDKKEKKIHFGIMDIGITSLNVGITYKHNGSIVNLFFEDVDNRQELEAGSPLGQRLRQAVRKARKNKGAYKKFFVKMGIKSHPSLSSYKGENFTTRVSADGFTDITFPIYAHGESQVHSKFFPKLKQIMDFLSVETNSPFERDYKYHTGQKLAEISPNEVYQVPVSINDSFTYHPFVRNGYIVISEIGQRFLDYIANTDKLDKDLALFLKACSHYHTARKHDDQLTEIATTLYLSALEVTTLIGFQEETCKECSQPKYKISKRVRGLAEKYLSADVAKDFIEYYDKRSKYLHRGEMLSEDSFSSHSFPMLDKDSEHGCKMGAHINLMDIRKNTGYILREFYKEYFVNKCL
ncbi:hypothetical protein CN373_07080 [Bacillus cereus]|uniref:hypothetical protein n=1 Tax=Bacillus cereus TaxID=1396 RepID=UPI000BF46413|nr:hypothetical protein [Bacillus cereus]PFA23138.1 hypothetical protein CN373_07080 [Bacillus cereus]